MKSLVLVCLAGATLAAGCVAVPYDRPPPPERRLMPPPVYGPGGDRDRDGVPNRYDRDRDGDGVPNRRDRAPNDPRYH